MSDKKESITTFRPAPKSPALELERADELRDFLDHLGIQRVVDPPPLTPVYQDTRLFERLEMEGESGLPCVEHIRQIADALLALAQAFDDL